MIASSKKTRVNNDTTKLSPDEKYLATDVGRSLMVWAVADKGLARLPQYEIMRTNPKRDVRLLGFSDDSRYLIAGNDRPVLYYEAATGQPGPPVPASVEVKYRADSVVYLTPDKNLAVVETCEGASVLDVPKDQKLYQVKFKCYEVEDVNSTSYYRTDDFVLLDKSGQLLADFRDKDRSVRVRNLQTGEVVQTLGLSNKDVPDKTLAPRWSKYNWRLNGNYFLARGGDDRSMLIYEVKAPADK